MVYVPFAMVVIVLLAGLVAVSMGWKQWHVATIVAAWLLFLATGGFVFLASMRAERESAWAQLVQRYESSTRKVADAQTKGADGFYKPIGECSLDDLGNCSLDQLVRSRNAWRRVLSLVDSWRGRFWPKATFSPPNGGNAGLLAIDIDGDPGIAVGAILYVFDHASRDGDGTDASGEFVGAFTAEKIEGKEISIIPLGENADNPLLAEDRERWNRPHDSVTVYESLPVDRRSAFTRVDRTPEPSLNLANAPSISADVDEPSDAAEEIPSKADSETPPSDVRWAAVTFEDDYVWKLDDGSEVTFQANDVFPEFPASEIPKLKDEGVKFQYRWVLPPGVYWANVTLTKPWSPPGEKGGDDSDTAGGDLPSGSKVAVPLDLAWVLEADDAATIESTFRLRPLADGSTSLEGIPAIAVGSEQFFENAGVEGINRLAVTIGRETDELRSLRKNLEEAGEKAKERRKSLESLKESVERELGNWKLDGADADAMQASLQSREQKAETELRRAEADVKTLSTAYQRTLQIVADEIRRRSPR